MERNIGKKWLVIGIILLFVGIVIAPAIAQNTEKSHSSRGNWLYVGGNGQGNYSSIQDAINASLDGDTVFVYAGTYYEHVKVFRAIHLLGQASDVAIIDGQDTGSVVVINATVTISGFTIQHSGHLYGIEAGVLTKSQPDMSYVITVEGNHILDNNIGVSIQQSRHDNILGNTITNNEKGISLFLAQDCNISHNNFINNTVDGCFRYFIGLQKHPRNNWNENYWDDWSSMLPKPIKGTKELIVFVLRPGVLYTIPFKWLNFDWSPEVQPSDSHIDRR